mgnify:CR=1 FL=1
MLRNYLMFSTFDAARGDWVAPRTRFVEVFFNQEPGQPVSYADYRGCYLLVERIKRAASRVDVAKINPLVADPSLVTGGYLFKTDKPTPGSTSWTTPRGISIQSADPDTFSTSQRAYLQKYLADYEAVLHSNSFSNPETGYAAWIDVSSFIDSQWAVEIPKQIDGYVFSTYYHKDRGGKVRAGPLWDFNISMGNADYAEGEFRTGWNYAVAPRTAPLAVLLNPVVLYRSAPSALAASWKPDAANVSMSPPSGSARQYSASAPGTASRWRGASSSANSADTRARCRSNATRRLSQSG